MRINAALVQTGFVNSRRAADEVVKDGGVQLNGHSISDLSTQVQIGDTITIDGVTRQLDKITQELILLNKPVGYACSHKAQKGQKTIFSLLPSQYHHYKIAGRLDIDSRGLVILASSGMLAHTIMHPSYKQLKRYTVTTKESITTSQLARLAEPIEVTGRIVQANKVTRLSATSVQIAISQGLNRQLRHMFGKLGLSVTDLCRIGIGHYVVDNIEEGAWQLVSA